MNLIQKAYAATFDFLQNTSNEVNPNANWQDFVGKVINVILSVAGALAIIYLIYSGILYITAAGNPDSAKKGQQGIINAVIGIVIIVAAYFIVGAVVNLARTATN